MPIIYDGQVENYYGNPKFGYGFTNTKKKKLAFSSLYSGGAWRDFGNNVVIGNGKLNDMKPEFKAEKKQKEIKQQEALDKIIKKTRTKEDIISGGAFKIC